MAFDKNDMVLLAALPGEIGDLRQRSIQAAIEEIPLAIAPKFASVASKWDRFLQQQITTWKERSALMMCKTCVYYQPGDYGLGRCTIGRTFSDVSPAVVPSDYCEDHTLEERDS